MNRQQRRIRVLTWHIHGSYLYYLSKANIEIYLPINSKRSDGYIGRGQTFPFDDNVIEVEAENIRLLDLDCIIYQSPQNYLTDQYEILSPEQRCLPRFYLEHDPPIDDPVNMRHVVNDPEVVIVHVTHFNRLMWDNNSSRTVVIDHGVPLSPVTWSGDLPRGIVVINNLHLRGRRLGFDIFERVRQELPIDLVGMNTEVLGGLGEVLHPQLAHFMKPYRFFFNPIRYTSLGLAVLEAMMMGMPVVGFSTTEMTTVFENGVSGWVHTDLDFLIARMKDLLTDRESAQRIGAAGRSAAMKRFSIDRFKHAWEDLFYRSVAEQHTRHPTTTLAP
jgi:hypothetical protein